MKAYNVFCFYDIEETECYSIGITRTLKEAIEMIDSDIENNIDEKLLDDKVVDFLENIQKEGNVVYTYSITWEDDKPNFIIYRVTEHEFDGDADNE